MADTFLFLFSSNKPQMEKKKLYISLKDEDLIA